MRGALPQVRITTIAPAFAETAAAVLLATGAVALLDGAAPATGLSVLYLPAVLVIAIRRGQLAALVAAVAGVLTLNFFFIPPRHHLTISESENVVALVVLLIVAVVVGRLAAVSRDRAGEADRRARLALAREREAALVAKAAASVVAGTGITAQLENIGQSIAEAVGASRARVELASAPRPAEEELAMRLPMVSRSGWLYVTRDLEWDRADLDRIAEPLAGLVEVALERERVGAQAADAEMALRADVAKTAVLHAISHDFRSPLTAITTAAAALRSGALSAHDRRDLISVIETESARLARLVEDLLDLSRIQAGAVNPRPDWCDLHDVVANAAAHVRALRGEHPIDFALPANLPLVKADAAQLERVFVNLIENAIRFSPGGATVRISGGAAGANVTVRVIDQGRGIPPSQRAHVFEPFFRGRGSGQGSGLGLAICRGFVEANGGRIALQTGTGEGTSFTVRFPLVSQPTPTA